MKRIGLSRNMQLTRLRSAASNSRKKRVDKGRGGLGLAFWISRRKNLTGLTSQVFNGGESMTCIGDGRRFERPRAKIEGLCRSAGVTWHD
jgi:hypothetical protein